MTKVNENNIDKIIELQEELRENRRRKVQRSNNQKQG